MKSPEPTTAQTPSSTPETELPFEGRELPQKHQVWHNNKRDTNYRIAGMPEWSDSPEEDNLEQWIFLTRVDTGKEYTRSLKSFMGTNRNGQPRFTRVI